MLSAKVGELASAALDARPVVELRAHFGEDTALTASDLSVVVIGIVITLFAFVLVNVEAASTSRLARMRKIGAPLLTLGLCVVAIGPALVG